MLLSIHPYQPQKKLIRDVFCQKSYLYEKLHCGVCGEKITELSYMKLNILQSTKELHLHLTCCNNLAHVHCLKVCPSCNATEKKIGQLVW